MGVFRYTCMPFSSAPSCFQKIMATIFAAVPEVVVYLDDIVVHGETSASHNERLSRVLDILSSHNKPQPQQILLHLPSSLWGSA